MRITEIQNVLRILISYNKGHSRLKWEKKGLFYEYTTMQIICMKHSFNLMKSMSNW